VDESNARALLNAELARVNGVKASAGKLTTAEGEAPNQSGLEQAAETLERELDDSVIQHADEEIREVEAALSRLDAHTYGRCEVCGGAIPDERLEALPATRYCVDDQARVEREPWLKG
jgi:RNA polymerase-binding transcription factor